MPQTLNYNIGFVEGAPISVGETDWSAAVDNISLSGTYEVSTKAMTANRGSWMYLTFGGAFAGQVPLYPWVEVPMGFVVGQLPTIGELWARYSEIAEVRTTVDNSVPGVVIRNFANGQLQNGPDTFGWDAFLDTATDPSAQPYQRDASLGFFGMQFVYDQAAIGMKWLEYINTNGAALQSAGNAGITLACDALGGGTARIVWTDANGGGTLGPGDNFTVTYTRCFVDVPNDDVDEFLDGTVTVVGFTRTDTPFAVGGELRFTDFQRTETEMVGGTPQATEHVWTVDGALNLFFSAP